MPISIVYLKLVLVEEVMYVTLEFVSKSVQKELYWIALVSTVSGNQQYAQIRFVKMVNIVGLECAYQNVQKEVICMKIYASCFQEFVPLTRCFTEVYV